MANSAPNIGSVAQPAKSDRLGDNLSTRIGTLLTEALANVTVLEVRTYTSESGETSLATTGDPLVENTRLRAFTRVAIDGDTQVCVPLLASGEPDETLWRLHVESVTQARADRATTLDMAMSLLKSLTGK